MAFAVPGLHLAHLGGDRLGPSPLPPASRASLLWKRSSAQGLAGPQVVNISASHRRLQTQTTAMKQESLESSTVYRQIPRGRESAPLDLLVWRGRRMKRFPEGTAARGWESHQGPARGISTTGPLCAFLFRDVCACAFAIPVPPATPGRGLLRKITWFATAFFQLHLKV